MATDGGQHLGGDPVLEDLRLRELGAEDEGVETRLVDDGKPSVRNVLTFKGSIFGTLGFACFLRIRGHE